jgi:hypothetical protein
MRKGFCTLPHLLPSGGWRGEYLHKPGIERMMNRPLPMESNQAPRGASIFGFPLAGFSLFQSLLLAVASAFLTFFATTCVSIFALLGWNLFGHHTVSFADTYRYVGLPAGLLVLLLALPFFLAIWVRAKVRK